MAICLPLAEEGNAKAQAIVGKMYQDGRGVEQNPEEADKWYRRAAEQGLMKAQIRLGINYFFGDAVKKDHVEAFKWFLKSAEQGDILSQYYVAKMYEKKGNGINQNDTEALK